MYNLWDRIKIKLSNLFQSRIAVIITVFCILSLVLVHRVFYLQIVKGQEYYDNYKLQIQKTKDVEGTRGNIYDRNGELLAYNELAFSVTIEDNGDYDSLKEKNKEINKAISTVIDMVESNGDTVINDFGIILDHDNNYMYVAKSNAQRLRFIADVYGQAKIDALTEEQKNQSAEELMIHLCTDERSGYGIDMDKYDKEFILKLVNVRYAMSLNSYQKYITTTISADVSDATVADVMENIDTLQGVNIEEVSMRRYTDSECFANIIGYTGQISIEEYEELSASEKNNIDKTDTIGKAGLEKELDDYLRGKKGNVKLYVNNVGRVIETVQGDEPEAGNNVYLTIDAGLQTAAYNILEQELAGIVLANLRNTLTYDRSKVSDGSKVIIPVGDVYDAFISNNILDISHFGEPDAKETEQKVHKNFTKRKTEVMEELEELLNSPKGAAYKDCTKEFQAYQSYIVNDLLTYVNQILISSAIDTNDETYQAWRTKETINIYEYLNYAISKNWIDTSKLNDYMPVDGKYTNSSQIYEALTTYILDKFESNTGFDKLVYRYMIRSKKLTGRQICLMLYEQDILEFKQNQYNRLKSGDLGPYDFIRGKIETLEITPGQLGLEPCTGSLVMTDTNSGEVLACVSYPGYDNNRLANSMDSEYYNKLVTDSSRPFYNNATQEKTAPGSTYKPLIAIAGSSEGVIDTSSIISCSSIYKKVEPNPKCWFYPDAHGGLTMSGAIQHSCNCYFYEVGYRLSLKGDGRDKISVDNAKGDATAQHYSSSLGTDTIAKYAEMFGLNETSGIEVPEAEPEISDEMSVPTAIGQGTNNYTTSQLARYVTAIANKGDVYRLSLLDKVTSVEGKVLKEYNTEITNTIDGVSPDVWNSIHEGMRNVVLYSNTSVFSELQANELHVSGKTGTAQQSKTHPDHGLFVGFAPSENPEVAFAIRIANGYSSKRAAEVGRDVMKYYYNIGPEDKIITGRAATLTAGSGGD